MSERRDEVVPISALELFFVLVFVSAIGHATRGVGPAPRGDLRLDVAPWSFATAWWW
jgi:low temperature requirement protein LtrA